MLPFQHSGVVWLLLASIAAQTQGSEQEQQQPALHLMKYNSSGSLVENVLTLAALADGHKQECNCSASNEALVALGSISAQLTELDEQLEELDQRWKPGQMPGSEPEPEPEPEPMCIRHPMAIPSKEGPYKEPTQRACAHSCLQLRDQGGSPHDGVYWFTGMPVPTLCDFSHDGGGWTLLLTAVSNKGWNQLTVLGRSERSPSLTADYSILRHADAIRNLGKGAQFAYRIEAQAETGRRHWGGIWWAPRHYSFVHPSSDQTDVTLAVKFDKWNYQKAGIEKRMPWIRPVGGNAILSTSTSPWWGALVSSEHKKWKHSPWINRHAKQSGTILYWMREEMV